MERELVASSNVHSIGYDEAQQTLEVEFQNGGVYHYYNVPASLFQQLKCAASKDAFLNADIKSAYPFSCVG